MRTWIARTATLLGLLVASPLLGQESSTLETGSDGVTYRVTRRVVTRAVPSTEIQTREEKFYQPRIATEYQSYPQTYVTPVTQYRWVSRLRGWWNPLGQPYWTHHLEPHTYWAPTSATVQVPVARTEWVEGTRSIQTPVTTYRNVQEEYTSRVAVSVSPGSTAPRTFASQDSATSIATLPATPSTSNRYGGERLENDPPRGGSD